MCLDPLRQKPENLEYDCPPTPKLKIRRPTSVFPSSPIFQPFGVYCRLRLQKLRSVLPQPGLLLTLEKNMPVDQERWERPEEGTAD